ncbi:hypothetical protein K466DRAFT_599123 [Polyporus arcularius HHB13444]|uniref:Uncharacterized protein n=1 Tax=Polyporus arcularius HHB13444 TaxID=1314778 RepID=A0A5C3PGY8_9APHY|nr:hypothetical protein K466DRAFT_599123 [Polyporus arcularius HHB13444]
MAPSSLISSTSQTGHGLPASGRTKVNADATNTLNPLGPSFDGPAVTAGHEDTSAGPSGLLLDPTGSTATPHVPASATQTFSILPLVSFTPSSEAVPAPSQFATGNGHPSISQATLIGVTVAISVIACTALCLLYYLYWRKKRPTVVEAPAVPVKEKERRRVTWTLRGIISERDARDPFADVHQPLPTPPALPADTKRESAKVVQCATDAGSVYVLDGECIYGDNGASVKGVLPPAYEDLPRKTLQRELPPLPMSDGHSTSSQQISDLEQYAGRNGASGA